MIGTARVENFRAAMEEVNRNNIPGAIVELGVWRGGAMILAAAVCKDSGIARDLFVVDAFEDIPPGQYGMASGYLRSTEKQVEDNFRALSVYDPNHVHFIKGLFKDTVPAMSKHDKLDSIAVLRVDANFYDSYQDVMYLLYEKVPVGGIVIFDDVFTHAPVTEFWDHFKQDQGITEVLNRIDRHSGWFRKTKAVTIDQSKMRSARDVHTSTRTA